MSRAFLITQHSSFILEPCPVWNLVTKAHDVWCTKIGIALRKALSPLDLDLVSLPYLVQSEFLRSRISAFCALWLRESPGITRSSSLKKKIPGVAGFLLITPVLQL